MKHLLWLTDIHLNFLAFDQIGDFLETVNQHPAHAVIISGDIIEAPELPMILNMMERFVKKPVYFVCGNHDFYYGSIADVRETLADLTDRFDKLTYLTQEGIVELTSSTALIGHDGWADGRYGNYDTSPMILNDFNLIKEMRQPLSRQRLEKMNTLGDQSASHFNKWLPDALTKYQHVIVVTHVPPFEKTCLKDGKPSQEFALPFYANRAAGEALLDIATKYPEKQITVLCGHTHSACDIQVVPNLRVVVGHAEYGKPIIQPLVLTVP